MTKSTLTDITIRQLLPPPKGQVDIWDSKLPGFGVRLTSRGTRTFFLLYRYRGRSRRLHLGRYPDTNLAQARDKAADALASVRRDVDPQQETPRIVPSQVPSDLFPTVMQDYVKRHLQRHAKPTSAAEFERILRRDFEPHWRDKLVADITKRMIRDRLEQILDRDAPSAANHAFEVIRAFLNWCVDQEYIDVSPCLRIKRPAPKQTRDRVINDDELQQIWAASCSVGYPFGPIVQLLLLTAQRRSEVASMRWPDLNLKDMTWDIPRDLNKSGRAYTIPLTPFTRDLILLLPRIHDTWVFPARRGLDQHFIGFNKGKNRLDKLITDKVTADPTLSPPAHWTLHDLRRTADTGMARLKVPPHVIERVLNHVVPGVAGIYNRFTYLPEMREALSTWEAYLSTNVMPRQQRHGDNFCRQTPDSVATDDKNGDSGVANTPT